ALEGESNLVWMEDVKDRHFMSLETQMLKGVHQAADVVETVRDQEDEAAPPGLLSEVVQQWGDGRLLARLGALQLLQDRLHVAGLTARRQAESPGRIEDAETDAVALMDNHISQCRCQQFGVLQLVRLALAVEHRTAGVHEDVTDEVRLLLVLLDGVALGTAV